MSRFVFFLFLATVAALPHTQSVFPRPIKVNGLWGYIDSTGRTVIDPTFNRADDFSEGLAYVERGSEHFFIGPSGATAFVLPKDAKVYGSFSSGLILYEDKGSNGLTICGFVDSAGKLSVSVDNGVCILAPLAIPRFSGGLANAREVFLNERGEKVAPLAMTKTWPASEGLARFEAGGRIGFVSAPSGVVAINARYTAAEPFSEGLAAVRFEQRGIAHSGFIDTEGNMVIDAPDAAWSAEVDRYDCDAGSAFHEGFAAVRVSTAGEIRSVYIDKKGVIKISEKFIQACPFLNGIALVIGSHGKAKLINKSGATVATIPGVLSGTTGISQFVSGLAKVTFPAVNENVAYVEFEWGYVNTRGKVVWDSH